MNYAVIYRTGGTERFEWRTCLDEYDYSKACEIRDAIQRMGYKAIVHRTDRLATIGLPETWD